MKNPLGALQVPRWFSGSLARTALYSGVLLALLAYLSYRLVYSHPAQVQRRLQRQLEPYLVDVSQLRIHGASYSYGDGTRLERIEIPAAPVLEEHLLGRLEGISIGPAAGGAGSSLGLRGRLATAARGGLASMHVETAHVDLEHQSEERPGDRGGRWNFGECLRLPEISQELRTRPLQISLDAVKLSFHEIREKPLRCELRDVIARREREALTFQGQLPGCEHWVDGEIRGRLSPVGDLSLHAHLRDFRSLELWIPLFPEGLRNLVTALEPRGTHSTQALRWDQGEGFTVDLELGVRRQQGRNVELTLLLQHSDTSLRLWPSGPRLAHVKGRMRVQGERLLLGTDTGPTAKECAPLECQAWGTECLLSGELRPSGGSARLRLPTTSLARVPASRFPAPVRSVLEGLRPTGHVEGELVVTPKSALHAWQSELRLADVEFHGFSPLAVAAATLTLTAGEMKGAGKLALDGLRWEGLGEIHGELAVNWDAVGLSVKAFDLRVRPGQNAAQGSEEAKSGADRGTGEGGAPSGEGRGDDPARPSSRRSTASLFGELSWARRDGALKGEAKWSNVQLDCGVLQAARVGGTLRFQPGSKFRPDLRGWILEAVGDLQLREIELPPGVAGEERLSFSTGNSRLRLDLKGLEIAGLSLTGPSGTLRAGGRIAADGEVGFLLLHAGGEAAERLAKLPLEAPPSAWLGAAGEDFRAYRLGGYTSAPASRPTDATDPAFRPTSP